MVGNQLRQSSAVHGQAIADNLPGLFSAEEWRAFYWTMDETGVLRDSHFSIHLPLGVSRTSAPIRIGEPGIVEHVRRWGVAVRGGILEDIGFDTSPMLTHDRNRFSSDDQEALHLVTNMTHFDLPGYFIIASDEHPFLLFDPEGILKGSFTGWYTYAGALAFLVTDGRLQTSFALTYEKDRHLYEQVMMVLNELLDERKTRPDQSKV